MSMLSSYTILNRAPLLGPRAAAATLVSPPRPVPAVVSSGRRRQSSSSRARRPPLFVCQAAYEYDDIVPTTLSNRGPTTSKGKYWSIIEDDDLTIFKLTVGESTSKEKLQLVPRPDKNLLDIKYTGGDAACPAINLGHQLVMPLGHDSKQVTASKAREFLVIIIPKTKPNPDSKSLGISGPADADQPATKTQQTESPESGSK
ncbi:hypothetical protein BS78_08G150400 [Paspalum vaginatum]|nr:hypothetical protein BS78_08G150400 [Paspalum vaginatum]